MGAPPIAAAASPSMPQGDLLAQGLAPGAAQDAVRQQLEGLMGQVREIVMSIDNLAMTFPMIAGEAESMKQLAKQMIIKAAQASSAQTASGMAVPMGGGPVGQ